MKKSILVASIVLVVIIALALLVPVFNSNNVINITDTKALKQNGIEIVKDSLSGILKKVSNSGVIIEVNDHNVYIPMTLIKGFILYHPTNYVEQVKQIMATTGKSEFDAIQEVIETLPYKANCVYGSVAANSITFDELIDISRAKELIGLKAIFLIDQKGLIIFDIK